MGRVEAAGVGHVVSRPQHGGDAHAPAHGGQLAYPLNVAGCYRKAEEEMNKWIAKDMSHVEDGLHGTIDDLKGWEAWTASPRDCLNIQDMEVDAAPGAVETNALVVSDGEDEDEEAGVDGESGEGGDDDD